MAKRNPRKPLRRKHPWLTGDRQLDAEMHRPLLLEKHEWLRLLFSLERRYPGSGARHLYAAHLEERKGRNLPPCLSPLDVARAEADAV